MCKSCHGKRNGFKKGHKLGYRFGGSRQDMKGSKHWNWNGGITSQNTKIRNSGAYKKWRTAVFERDDYTCQECGERGGVLNADHIKPFSLYPELRLELTNGRTLCKECHDKIGWSFFKEMNPRKQHLQLTPVLA